MDGNVARVGEQPKHLFLFWLDDDIMAYIDDIGGDLRWRDDLEERWKEWWKEWWEAEVKAYVKGETDSEARSKVE